MRASFCIVGCGLVFTLATACKTVTTTSGSGGTTSAATGTTTKASSASSTKAATGATTGATTGSGTSTGAVGTGGAGGGGMAIQCNPVTAKECNVAGGDTCDIDTASMSYVCFDNSAGPNTAAICTKCDNSTFCAAGLTCITSDAAMNSQCMKYCCSDADCGGATGSCTMGIAPKVGICGALDSTMKFATPVCTGVPATAPSMGACYTVPAGG